MNRWKMFAVLMTASLLASFAAAQDPERQAKLDLAQAALDRGRTLLYEKKYDEAIAAFREAVEIRTKLYGFDSYSHYELAQALTAAGRTTEALEAYRQAVRWDSEKEELSANDSLAMDYAIVLAQCGKVEDAKAMYYCGLRRFNELNPYGMSEPVPFLVVFDPDPTMVYWQYTTERLIAAATVIKAKRMQLGRVELLNKVRQFMPDWIVPAMDLVWPVNVVDLKEADRFYEAASLAQTPEEREWISAYQHVFESGDWQVQLERWTEVANKMAAIGAARRKASVVLEQARQNLKNIHHRIAVERVS